MIKYDLIYHQKGQKWFLKLASISKGATGRTTPHAVGVDWGIPSSYTLGLLGGEETRDKMIRYRTSDHGELRECRQADPSLSVRFPENSQGTIVGSSGRSDNTMPRGQSLIVTVSMEKWENTESEMVKSREGSVNETCTFSQFLINSRK